MMVLISLPSKAGGAVKARPSSHSCVVETPELGLGQVQGTVKEGWFRGSRARLA